MIETFKNTATSEADRQDQASQWFARRRSDDFTPEDELAFYAWCADSDNFDTYERLDELWDGLSDHAQDENIKLWSQKVTSTAKIYQMPKKKWGMALAAIAASLFGFAYVTQFHTADLLPEEYRTETGQQQIVSLADSSVITLNTNTKLQVTLSGSQRHIDLLEGEAFFDVSPDPDRPFTVAVDDITVKVVGTEFNVHRLKSNLLRVSVTEGKVLVYGQASGIPSSTLVPGDILSINSLTGEINKQTIGLDHISAWKRGILEFSSVSLEDAITEVNRYTEYQIRLKDDAFKKMTISGIFMLKDIDNFVPFIEKAFNLKAQTVKGNVIELVRNNDAT